MAPYNAVVVGEKSKGGVSNGDSYYRGNRFCRC